jgi:hypothetical protein
MLRLAILTRYKACAKAVYKELYYTTRRNPT